MYTREVPGEGTFEPLSTDVVDGDLVVSTGSFSEFVFASDSNPLPVEMASFDGTSTEEEVRLAWQTASETNNAGFRVQRRIGEQANGREGKWEQVGRVEGTGTTTDAQAYRFVDEDLPYAAEALTYRLKQVDADGTTTLSDPITVDRGTVTEPQLLGTFPNPARSQTTVRFAVPEEPAAGDVTLRLYDVLGRAMRTVTTDVTAGRHEVTLDAARLPSGLYFLRLTAGGSVKTQRLTVVR